jgi:hypothetical protein
MAQNGLCGTALREEYGAAGGRLPHNDGFIYLAINLLDAREWLLSLCYIIAMAPTAMQNENPEKNIALPFILRRISQR